MTTTAAPTIGRRVGTGAGGASGRFPGLGMLGLLAALLLVFFLLPFVLGAFRFPLGPDVPVYLWWTRLAGHEGLSSVGERPGVPSLLLTLSETLRLPLVAVTAGVEVALGVSVGLAAAALVRERFGIGQRATWVLEKLSPERDRPEWLLAGLLSGAFAVHLVAGYLSNLAFAVGFLAAAAALAVGTRRGALAAAGLLGAAGLHHPYFFLIGLAVLVPTAVPSFRSERGTKPWRDTEFGRIAVAAGGGGLVAGAGLLAMLNGPSPPDIETSKDGLLRRAGLTNELAREYRERFLRRWTRYVQWVSVPLAMFGLREADGFVGRLMRAWGGVTIAGVAGSLVTGLFPADRFVTFGYVVPILAALGLVRLARALVTKRAVAGLVTGLLLTLMLAGAGIAWFRQEPFVSEEEVRTVTESGRYVSAIPSNGSAAYIVEVEGETGGFELARAGNVFRAALPPARIRSVIVGPTSEGPAPTDRGGTEDRIRELARARLREAIFGSDPVLLFALRPFIPDYFSRPDDPPDLRIAPGVQLFSPPAIPRTGALMPRPAPLPVAVDPLETSSPGGITLASIVVLVMLGVAGYGWARAALGVGTSTLALAPAFGMAALTIAGVALERVGVPQTGPVGPTLMTVLAGGGGYLVAFLLQRRSVAQPPAQVEEQPHQ